MMVVSESVHLAFFVWLDRAASIHLSSQLATSAAIMIFDLTSLAVNLASKSE